MQCLSAALAEVSYPSLRLALSSSLPFPAQGVCSCFDLACWGKSSLILFQSVVEPVLTAVRTHIAHLVSLLAFLTGSDRDAALGKKRFLLVEVESMGIYPQLSYEASFLAPISGFSLVYPHFSPLQAQVPPALHSLGCCAHSGRSKPTEQHCGED